ncbi:universal stress protein [Massilia sp. Mn16-1_5]|uniref:universal stress protein n=1 Tax=Massilia sp. Mn16-1_5 TaxID=2079199 RepID=UPI00109EB525|nr:universal stress protein [Massilia sp. Mn16-1_5]
MRYKTVLVHADLSRHAPARIELAAAICAEHGAHLVGAAMTGVSREVFPKGCEPGPCTLLAGYTDPLMRTARRALDGFEDIARRRGVSYEPRLISDQAPDALALLARVADLVVLSQDDPDESLGYLPSAMRMPDYVLVNAARPVLVVPRVPHPPACPRRVLLCWNGSREAVVAMTAAIPLLQRATQVSLAVFTPVFPNASMDAAAIDDALAYLGRHAVRATHTMRDPGHDTGRAILALAQEEDADLVVMGCFGHSRFQELLLGGASRTVLQHAVLPVLMAR